MEIREMHVHFQPIAAVTLLIVSAEAAQPLAAS